jgi:hypothetical protein
MSYIWASSRGPCSSCDTASTSHHCILAGTHGTCQRLLLLAYFRFRFQSQHLLLKGLRALYQRLHLRILVERDLLPARHGAIRDTRTSDLAVDRQEDLEDTDQEDHQADPLEDHLEDHQADQDPFLGTQAPEVEEVAEAS